MEYFDFNATTPVCDEALEALMRVTRDFHGNPSSLHRVGRRADHILDDSRQSVAEVLGCQPADIVWTSGATESNNMVFNHLSQQSPAGSTVLISDIEHPCVRKSAHYYFCQPSIGRAMPVSELEKKASEYELKGTSYLTVREAFELALKESERMILFMWVEALL